MRREYVYSRGPTIDGNLLWICPDDDAGGLGASLVCRVAVSLDRYVEGDVEFSTEYVVGVSSVDVQTTSPAQVSISKR
jgi:hypothetical protein